MATGCPKCGLFLFCTCTQPDASMQWLHDLARKEQACDMLVAPGVGEQPRDPIQEAIDEMLERTRLPQPSRLDAMAHRLVELTEQLRVAFVKVADMEDRVAQLTHDMAHLRAPQPVEKVVAFPARALRWSR